MLNSNLSPNDIINQLVSENNNLAQQHQRILKKNENLETQKERFLREQQELQNNVQDLMNKNQNLSNKLSIVDRELVDLKNVKSSFISFNYNECVIATNNFAQ
eukprot:Pgem_evm1s9306